MIDVSFEGQGVGTDPGVPVRQVRPAGEHLRKCRSVDDLDCCSCFFLETCVDVGDDDVVVADGVDDDVVMADGVDDDDVMADGVDDDNVDDDAGVVVLFGTS